MGISPAEVIEDLEKYISLYDIKISKEVKKILEDIEDFSFKCNYPCNYRLFFSRTIRNMKDLQRLFYGKGMNPNLAALTLEIGFYRSIDTQTNYQRGTKLYSYIHDRAINDKTAILDRSMQYCVKEERGIIEGRDIIMAAMDYFENYRLNHIESNLIVGADKSCLGLCHVHGEYDENLSLSFRNIKEGLEINNKISPIEVTL